MPHASIEDIRAAAIRLHLFGSLMLAYLPIDVLAKCYNGTGPEFLPDAIRAKLDAIARPFLPAVMVHDVDYTFSDGSLASFRAANLRLLLNCLICAVASTTWYSWRRYALILEAWALYRACSKFGWIAWILAYNKTKGKTNE